ncbi:unnamed protein product, partial [marine sediment metagenome]
LEIQTRNSYSITSCPLGHFLNFPMPFGRSGQSIS